MADMVGTQARAAPYTSLGLMPGRHRQMLSTPRAQVVRLLSLSGLAGLLAGRSHFGKTGATPLLKGLLRVSRIRI